MTRFNYKMLKIPKQKMLICGILLLLLFVFMSHVSAQNIKISGVVTDGITNETLPGVNVTVEATTSGAITDINGKYTLNVEPENSNLTFSFMGYITETVSINGRTQIDMVLVPDIKALNEVVVIGYGSARRADLSGSITTISSKEIADMPVTNVAQALTGRVAGLQVTQSDGAPDADVIMKIRGGGSLTQDNSPLLVVDGFPVNSMRDISPTDIETFVILKDASSTAIYGARGAYGVILITTKGAKSGKTKVMYNGYVTQSRFPIERSIDVLSPYDYALMRYEYAQLGGRTTPQSFEKLYGHYDDLELYKYMDGTDWQEELYGKPTWSQTHNLSMSGGTESTRVYFSVSHNDNQGLVQNSAYQRTTANLKLHHNVSDKLRLELNPRFSLERTDGAGTSAGSDFKLSQLMNQPPINGLSENIEIDPEELAGDEYEQFAQKLIPPDEKLKDDYKKKLENKFVLNSAINWRILKSLTYRAEISFDYNAQDEQRFYGKKTSRARNDGQGLPMGRTEDINSTSYRVANVLTFDLENPLYRLSIMAGQEILEKSGKRHEVFAGWFPKEIEPEKLFAGMDEGDVVYNKTFVASPDRIASFFGRTNLIILDRYILNGTIRYDGSTKFKPGKTQWGFFPAGSAAWRISNEPFLKNVGFINELKLRAGYGLAGNNNISSDIWRSVYELGTNNKPGFGDTEQPYYVASQYLPNPNLKWETKITMNVGTDFSFFNDRLIGTVEYYNNKSKDLLLEVGVPADLAYEIMIDNVGSTSVKGWEVTLNNTFIRKNDFALSASFNIGIENFVVDKLGDLDEIAFISGWSGDIKGKDDYYLKVGEQIGLMHGWVTDGFYTVDDFVGYDTISGNYILKDGVPKSELTANRPGSLKLKDLNSDSIVDMSDREIIGHANAKNYGGFGLNGKYKGLDLSVYFTWKYGFDVYNTSQIQFTNQGRDPWGNLLDRVNSENRFKYINNEGQLVTDLEELRVLNENATVWSPFSGGESSLLTHSDAIEDGSYLRLSTITLGYSLPQKFTSILKIQECRFYFTASNVWLWTNYRGFDPEVSTRTRERDELDTEGLTTPNLDHSAYPTNRSFTLGVNINF